MVHVIRTLTRGIGSRGAIGGSEGVDENQGPPVIRPDHEKDKMTQMKKGYGGGGLGHGGTGAVPSCTGGWCLREGSLIPGPGAFPVALHPGVSVAARCRPALLASVRLSHGFVGVGVLGVRLGQHGGVGLVRRRFHAGVARSDQVHPSSRCEHSGEHPDRGVSKFEVARAGVDEGEEVGDLVAENVLSCWKSASFCGRRPCRWSTW